MDYGQQSHLRQSAHATHLTTGGSTQNMLNIFINEYFVNINIIIFHYYDNYYYIIILYPVSPETRYHMLPLECAYFTPFLLCTGCYFSI